ncbi:MAG: CRISP-associated protein Cas1, partial [Kosmotoga sp.]|nr:CRISP-associated protein Cas1 [Kosmotoga sp.]
MRKKSLTLLSDGALTRREYPLFFENAQGIKPLSVEG